MYDLHGNDRCSATDADTRDCSPGHDQADKSMRSSLHRGAAHEDDCSVEYTSLSAKTLREEVGTQCSKEHSCLEAGYNVGCKVVEFFLALVQETKVAFEGGKDQCSTHNRDIVAFDTISFRSTD